MGALEGKVAIVTGGSRGIGRAIVERLVRDGCRVVFTYKQAEDAARAVVAALGEDRVLAVKAAVERLDDCKAAVKAAAERFGGVEILINNAGMVRDGALRMMPEDAWREVIEVELIGTINFIHAALPELSRCPDGAAVVNIGSIVGERGNAGQVNHSAAKAGVIGVTLSLSQELGPLGVRVNCVSPGAIETEMWTHTAQADKRTEKLKARTPLRRIGKPEEVAAAVAFLANSAESGFITGQVLGVNGGVPSAG